MSSSTSTTSINSSTSSSGTTRVTGLYSTLDVDGLVKASLTLQQSKIDKAQQSKTYAEWKQTAYKSVNTLVSEFKDKYLGTGSSSIALASMMNAKTVTQSSSTAMKITATSSASVDSFTVSSAKVATKAYVGSTAISDSVTNVTDKTIKELAAALDKDLTTTGEGDDAVITMNFGGDDMTFDTDTTVSAMMTKINNSGNGVKMIYNDFNNKFEIKSTETGAEATINMAGTDGLFFGSGGVFGSSTVTKGTNAEIVVDGEIKKFSSNSFEIGGFNFELLSDSTTAVDVNVKADVDGVYDKISSFVNDYNTLITSLTTMVNEKKDRDYDPLTDAEKEKLTDSQITKLEDKAKAGILYGDSGIRNLLTGLRGAVTSQLTESGTSLASIGITTGNYYSADKGKLVIDKDKLKSAIQNKPDEISELFTKTSYSSDATTKYEESGLAGKFKTLSTNYVSNTTNNTLASLTKSISSYTDKLKTLKELFEDKEDALYTKYSKLDVLLAQMSSASSSMFSE